MITDKQLAALINYIRAEAQSHARYVPCPEHEVRDARRMLCEVFGFETHKNGYPVKPKPHLATSDPEGHRQAIADADYETKHALLWALVAHRWSGVPMTQRELAADIMRLWSELKAIMEPEK